MSSLSNVVTLDQPIIQDIWYDKYRDGAEQTPDESDVRMVKGVCKNDTKSFFDRALSAVRKKMFIPAGRIAAGAGTKKRVTLINCYAGPKILDSMESDERGIGIMDALKVSAVTQQMGGGIGNDFSTVRPAGAIVKRTGSVSSGVLPFMDMWHSMCGTVMSSGSRRGAMMGTLLISHPDICDFIVAKQKAGRLTNFNVSVLVTDDFMEAKSKDLDWDLYFTVPRADGNHIDTYERMVDGAMQTVYVYQRIRARKLWKMILESTYVYAEPGIIFIDRVNKQNNLYYCEHIQCTNPCGEQPLPPNADCDLGHINLAVMVKHPFTAKAAIDFKAIDEATYVAVRFLDNVLDVTLFPTEAQRAEAHSKRRIGVGYTGLANMFQQLGLEYGSAESVEVTETVTRAMAEAAYQASADLAAEKGPFPLFDADKWLEANFPKKLNDQLRRQISKTGIRNGVLLTLAPVGTRSITAGNVSSGIEPIFSLQYTRKVLQEDGSQKTYDVADYGYLLWHHLNKYPLGSVAIQDIPTFVTRTAMELTVDQHLAIQAAAQKWIDASISKTINCPEEMSFEHFSAVYDEAYKLDLKGCTTYRPDPKSGRGAVLEEKKPEAEKKVEKPFVMHDKAPMQDIAEGRRYRIKWPNSDAAYYLQMNDYTDDQGRKRPFECFISSKAAVNDEWIKALTLTLTAIFRRGGDVTFIVDELKTVHAATGGAYMGGRYRPSLVAAIADRIEEHFRWLGLTEIQEAGSANVVNISEAKKEQPVLELTTVVGRSTGFLDMRASGTRLEICTRCSTPGIVFMEGCKKCTSCGWSACG